MDDGRRTTDDRKAKCSLFIRPPSSVVCHLLNAMTERPADRLAIAVAQLNPIVGDVSGNLGRARA
jgi:hypothetical protein